MNTDAHWLTLAVDLAVANVADGGGPFGAVIVADRAFLASGVNRVTPDLDPTAHAEIVAIRAACRAQGDFSLAGATLYASCEPCPLCLAASLWSRLDRIVYAADRHHAAEAGFDDLRFYELLAVHRADLPVRLERLAVADTDLPFAAWADKPDRVPY
ncbi:MAG: nucleoside deaminase [Dermatophilaceae bacterium]|nr:nucleoside deaminase [Intrasporangiaceae bacterium]